MQTEERQAAKQKMCALYLHYNALKVFGRFFVGLEPCLAFHYYQFSYNFEAKL